MSNLAINSAALRDELSLLVQTETLLMAIYDRFLPSVEQVEWQGIIRQFKEETRRHRDAARRLLGDYRPGAGRALVALPLPVQMLQGGYDGRLGELRGLQELMAHTFFGQGVWAILRAAAGAVADDNLRAVADGVLREKKKQVLWFESAVREQGLRAMTR